VCGLLVFGLMRNNPVDIIFYKAFADMKAEAARNYMGFIWWVLEPVLYMAVFYFIFTFVFHRGGEGFVPFLLCGLIVWKWFAGAILQGANSIIGSVGLMQQVYLPKYIFPSIAVLVNTLKFLPVFCILIIFLVAMGYGPKLSWFSLLLLLLTQTLWIFSVVCLTASLVPFLPDIKMIINNLMTLLFFMSGVFFDISKLSADVQFYFYLNPMAALIGQYHKVLLSGSWPDWSMLAEVALISVCLLALSLYILHKFDRVYPKVLM